MKKSIFGVLAVLALLLVYVDSAEAQGRGRRAGVAPRGPNRAIAANRPQINRFNRFPARAVDRQLQRNLDRRGLANFNRQLPLRSFDPRFARGNFARFRGRPVAPLSFLIARAATRAALGVVAYGAEFRGPLLLPRRSFASYRSSSAAYRSLLAAELARQAALNAQYGLGYAESSFAYQPSRLFFNARYQAPFAFDDVDAGCGCGAAAGFAPFSY